MDDLTRPDGDCKPAFAEEAAREYHQQRGAAVSLFPVAPGHISKRPYWADYRDLSPGFAAACLQVDAENWHRQNGMPAPRKIERGTAQTTVEALMYELRESGLDALKAPNARRRLGDLSQKQHREVLARLVKLRPRYPKITDELLVHIEELGQ